MWLNDLYIALEVVGSHTNQPITSSALFFEVWIEVQ